MKARSPELLVVSDSHGDIAVLQGILEWGRKRGIGAFAFLGDGCADFPVAADLAGFHPPGKRVRGNGDFDHSLPFFDTPEFAGKRFFLCHGHLHGVAEGFGPLVAAARSIGADAALFGHTHRAFWDELDGMLVLNPGSPSRPRGPKPTFATITVPSEGWFVVRHWALGRGALGGWIMRETELI